MIQLYDSPRSGHCHRVRLFLSILGIPYEKRPISTASGDNRRPEFLALNPFGQIPVLVDGDVVLRDSNAILTYLALRYGEERWLPRDPLGAARVQQWLSVAAGELHRGPAFARAATVFGRPYDIPTARRDAERLFGLLDAHLASREWLAAIHPTIADLALYAYLAVADEGGLDTAPHAALCAWLRRVEALPGFEPMPRGAPQPR